MTVALANASRPPETIPTEVMEEALSYLPLADLGTYSLVSRDSRASVHALKLWADIWERAFPGRPMPPEGAASWFMRFGPPENLVNNLSELRERLAACVSRAAAGPDVRAVCFFPENLNSSFELPSRSLDVPAGSPVLIASFGRTSSPGFSVGRDEIQLPRGTVQARRMRVRHHSPVLPIWQRVFYREPLEERLLFLEQMAGREPHDMVRAVGQQMNRSYVRYILPFPDRASREAWRNSIDHLLLEAGPGLRVQGGNQEREREQQCTLLRQALAILALATAVEACRRLWLASTI